MMCILFALCIRYLKRHNCAQYFQITMTLPEPTFSFAIPSLYALRKVQLIYHGKLLSTCLFWAWWFHIEVSVGYHTLAFVPFQPSVACGYDATVLEGTSYGLMSGVPMTSLIPTLGCLKRSNMHQIDPASNHPAISPSLWPDALWGMRQSQAFPGWPPPISIP